MNHRLNLRSVSVILSLWMLLGNCYFNPFVNGILNPTEEENNNSTLGLLGLGPSSIIVTGQLISLGAGVSGATVKIADSTDTTNQSVTNSAGRFKLVGSAGTMTLEVDHLGTVFRIELSVTPPIVTLNSISNSTYTVYNLEAYSSSLGDISFLDLTSSMPYNGLVVANANYAITVGSGFSFFFTENLELPSDNNSWRNENFLISPALSLYSASVASNNVNFAIDSLSYLPQNDYTLTLMPGIKSTTGKSMKPTTIRFRIGALAL
ncbi:carboxypeptidase-like regulatory domain-containing protein [Leptospira kanakyensis]|uniref:Carboxypeptidase regulatory-like domain-containing protein n=1 Tax=Leptospira kanakyensis TaxID=2484968 RepID=A0A6N4Q0D6_9LEPT|nr:carboxypeptidase-like regulatory domain-containing protein [Leptospira kanakyensis]MCW7479642.1 carboxypeptidase-like regulatory domain-containing protein [Leptospira kanakyensis]TGK51705.1 carboxypeptidase regulatory-like domain-containing protein [Leptospira kanakyensis]TGK58594.1 carboxypeptidase regulatory-like domain-containing protein [Leptospira kanakyensis]TGK70797.1 carboxypeptidase regulatory-like domain-containing protein [Leptospira kanakyensis]